MTLGLVGLQLLSPVPIKILIDNVFDGQKLTWAFSDKSGEDLLVIVAIMMVGIAVVRELYGVFQDYVFRYFSQIIDRKIMADVFQSVNEIPEGSPERRKPGEYVFAITNQSQQMSQLILVNIVTIIGAVITIVAILILMRNIDPGLMLSALLVFPPAIAFVYFLGIKLERNSDLTEKAHSAVFQFVNESIQKLRLVQSFVLEKTQLKRLSELVFIRNRHARKQTLLLGGLSGVDEVVLAISTALIVYVGGKNVFDGEMTLGDLFLFMAYLDFLYAPFAMIVDAIGSSKEQNAALKRAFEIVKSSEQLALRSGDKIAESIRGKVEFVNAEIKYGSRTIVAGANLTINPGELVAFMGPSGAGKSSLIGSIVRFVYLSEGSVKIDGVDVKEFDVRSLRSAVALVDQEPDMLDLSIGDNIALHDIDRENKLPDVMKAAIFGDIVDFVESDEAKYSKMMDGGTVSGGQKQRIGLARSYYKDAQIVLMDEPTSALDKTTAEKVRSNIKQYMAGRTVMIVTHDLELAAKADRVILVRDSKLEDVTGHPNYAELLK